MNRVTSRSRQLIRSDSHLRFVQFFSNSVLRLVHSDHFYDDTSIDPIYYSCLIYFIVASHSRTIRYPTWIFLTSRIRICRPFGSLSPSSSSTPRPKSGWSGLGAFATSDESNAAWKAIKAEEDEVESTIERHSQQGELSKIDWAYWEKTIKHKPIVDWYVFVHREYKQVLAHWTYIEGKHESEE